MIENLQNINQYLNIKLTFINCFYLLIPILMWNAIFASKLTQQGFKNDDIVPGIILALENVFRFIAFLLPIFLPLKLISFHNRIGLMIYIIGTIIYLASWLPLVYYPDSSWSNCAIGILAPFVTPVLSLIGIGLLSNSIIYISLAVIFIAIHGIHGIIGFKLIQ